MTHSSQDHLLEIYKLHAELFDRATQRRQGTNRLYVCLLSGFLVFFCVMFAYPGMDSLFTLPFLGIGGMGLSGSWSIALRSYRQLNEAQLAAFHELEQKLDCSFFRRQKEFLERSKNHNHYCNLIRSERFLPKTSFLLFFFLSIFGLITAVGSVLNATGN